jgi:hypothetical protein
MTTASEVFRLFRRSRSDTVRRAGARLTGKCVRCGRPAREGKRMCMACALAETARKTAEYHAKKGARKSA